MKTLFWKKLRFWKKPKFVMDRDYIIQRILNYFTINPSSRPEYADLYELDGAFGLYHLDLFGSTVNEMRELQIIALRDDRRYELKKLGYEIADMGGWKKYNRHKKRERGLVALKYTGFVTSIVFSAIALFTSISQKIDNTNMQTRLDTLEQKLHNKSTIQNTDRATQLQLIPNKTQTGETSSTKQPSKN